MTGDTIYGGGRFSPLDMREYSASLLEYKISEFREKVRTAVIVPDRDKITINRREMAREFRLRSDENYECARRFVELFHYRSACSACWFSTMQLITAATYESLGDVPPNNKTYWPHAQQSSLFRKLLRKYKLWAENKELVSEIELLRARRIDADYSVPELHSNEQGAKLSLESTSKLRAVIFQLMGSQWDHHESGIDHCEGEEHG